MNELILKRQKGFTIIEVVLVLAIAGLIFLTIFLALPALQKSQRDNARKQDVGRVVAGIQEYVANNGSMPANTTALAAGYVIVPDLGQLTQLYVEVPQPTCLALSISYTYMAYVSVGCKCSDAGTATAPVSGARYANVQTRLENGTRYCKDV